MSYHVTVEHVWVGAIPDRPAALSNKLKELANGGIDLELIIGWREQPGRGLLYVAPLRTMDEIRRAEQAGLTRHNSMRMIRVEGPNRAGLGALITSTLAEADINIASFTACSLGALHVTNITFDDDEDVDRARAILHKALAHRAAM